MKTPTCSTHNIEKRRKYNSPLFACPLCENEKREQQSAKRIARNKALLAQSPIKTSKSAKNGLKSKSKNFNIYTTTAWKWFSRYVLLFYADRDNVTICATSGQRMTITTKNCQCGHYIKTRDMTKTNYATAFDFRNVGPQSLQDNRYGGGRMDLMRDWLVKQHGEEAIQELEIKKHQICRLDKTTLDQVAEEYKAKFKQLLQERGIKDPWKK
ncbi:recombination protein NinG [Sunxiuqinia indica]|uniref:recombination protein NinG n=1 Tax=Sunxiuqinia indica TaxID=2692584 RepID=UPI00135C5E22|nr:recombination protein NinG [Sunxiuqinia indica]